VYTSISSNQNKQYIINTLTTTTATKRGKTGDVLNTHEKRFSCCSSEEQHTKLEGTLFITNEIRRVYFSS